MGRALACVLTALIGCGDDGAPGDGGLDAPVAVDAGPGADAGSPDGGDGGGAADADPEDDAAVDAGAERPDIDRLLATLGRSDLTEAEADDILQELAWGPGLPVGDGTRWLFLTRWDGAPSDVALVGDVNGWDPAAHPATRTASRVHFYAVLEEGELTAPAVGAKYKWHGAPGDVWRAPPEATAYGYDDFGEHGWVRPPPAATHFERFPELRSAHLELPRTVRVRVPATPPPPDARVLILHDGQNVFGPDGPFGGWRADLALERSGFENVLAVAVDNAADRMDAYTHVPDRIGGGTTGGRAEDYVALLRDEVLPFIRARYGVDAQHDEVMVGGSSLGGLVSLVIALRHDDLAACVAALSPTAGWGAFDRGASGADALARRWPAAGHRATAVYLDSGGGVSGACGDPDGDGIHEDADDSDNYCATLQLHDVLASLGYRDGEDLVYVHAPGASHDEAAWRERFPAALDACVAAGW